MTYHPIQLVLSAFVAVGIFSGLKDGTRRWVTVAYGITLIAYVLSVATEGVPKHVLGGFWYTDPHRLAVNVTLTAMPLAAWGVSYVYGALCGLSRRLARHSGRRFSGRYVPFAVVFLAVMSIFYPGHVNVGAGETETSFGNLGSTIKGENDSQSDRVLTSDEEAFATEALELIPRESLIINEPNDGSGFLYALDAANIYYRAFALPSTESEKNESQVIRDSLSEIETNTKVKDAVQAIGAQYVLVLDQDESQEDTQHFWSYYPEQWTGIESINDSTPGFSVVLARDDMRLYKIND